MKRGGVAAAWILSPLLALSLAAQETGLDAIGERNGSVPKTALSLDYDYDTFSDGLKPWFLAAGQLSHRFGFARVIGRVNRARRFGQSGTQFEVDAYPRIKGGLYAYLSAGWSRDGIFPDQRYGAEVFKNLPHAFEVSLGLRQLNFTSSNVTLYTGTIARYKGNNYYILRPYVSRDKNGISWSGQLTMRKYFGTGDEYVSLGGSYGKSPTDEITLDAVNRIGSWMVRATAQRLVTRNLMLSGRVGYRDQEIRRDRHRSGWFAGAGIERRF